MKELMIPVERAVRPVQANIQRKRRMRQELLAHLTSIYEEEHTRSGDAQQALAQALQRFGNPADLARDLQASVPAPERWIVRLVDRWLFPRPGEGALRHAVRLAVVFAAYVLVTLQLMQLWILLMHTIAQHDRAIAWIEPACVGVVTGYAFLATLVGYGFYYAFANCPSISAVLQVVGYGGAALLVSVALAAGGYVTQPSNPLWAFMLFHPHEPLALSALAFIAALPLVLALGTALIIRIERRRMADLAEWARLEIGE